MLQTFSQESSEIPFRQAHAADLGAVQVVDWNHAFDALSQNVKDVTCN